MVPFFGNKLYTRICEHNLDSWNPTSKLPGDVLLRTQNLLQLRLKPPGSNNKTLSLLERLAHASSAPAPKKPAPTLVSSPPASLPLTSPSLTSETSTQTKPPQKRPPSSDLGSPSLQKAATLLPSQMTAARTFSVSFANHGYKLLYLPLRRHLPIDELRSKLKKFKILIQGDYDPLDPLNLRPVKRAVVNFFVNKGYLDRNEFPKLFPPPFLRTIFFVLFFKPQHFTPHSLNWPETTDQIDASVSVLNLASTMDDKINKPLIVSASQLLQSLPMDPTNTDISETTLITRYTVTLLQPLFDNDD
ncbi:hypothetical protein G6F70_001110 [Rhizopus microsporus]|nr:hypothetical protein G6F71_001087 [Rhizopus microsporus]KAG1203734.1 hypothetical protein G6F70_001110 [Rhizopus microsporus]KAG1216399.1 hypothetical protein G6F69_000161 [Rhizopus microsporus]KAG1237688.1 hypothetical protein G6F67_001006 [Rhizopus microsporus]KAG1267541.1 hypothetical protein G6F68_001823 [Rhizopus microsporus]